MFQEKICANARSLPFQHSLLDVHLIYLCMYIGRVHITKERACVLSGYGAAYL